MSEIRLELYFYTTSVKTLSNPGKKNQFTLLNKLHKILMFTEHNSTIWVC